MGKDSLLEAALSYARRGLSVIPVHVVLGDGTCSCGQEECKAKGKHPRVSWRAYIENRAGRDRITSWWNSWPEANVGIVTGEVSGMAVIDVDGEEGVKSLEEAGMPLSEFPETPMARTGGGGYHIVLSYPGGSVGTTVSVLDHVDVRADGGFIVAPPSVHESGKEYRWLEGRDVRELDPYEGFDWVALVGEEVIRGERGGSRWYETLLQGVAEGERNSSATRLVGRYFAMGMASREVLEILRSWNMRNTPPLPQEEIFTVVRSIGTKEDSEEAVDRSDMVSTIGRTLGLDLLRIQCITGDRPLYVLEFAEGNCEMTTGQLLSPASFQRAIAEGTQQVVSRRSNKSSPTHESLVRQIMDCAIRRNAGREATVQGGIMLLLRQHLSSRGYIPHLKEGDDVPERGPFRIDGVTWISMGGLLNTARIMWPESISMRELAQRMRLMGLPRRRFEVNDVVLTRWGVKPSEVEWREDDEEDGISYLRASGNGEDDGDSSVGAQGGEQVGSGHGIDLLADQRGGARGGGEEAPSTVE